MRIEYTPQGVCSRKMFIDIDENDVVTNVEVIGGIVRLFFHHGGDRYDFIHGVAALSGKLAVFLGAVGGKRALAFVQRAAHIGGHAHHNAAGRHDHALGHHGPGSHDAALADHTAI